MLTRGTWLERFPQILQEAREARSWNQRDLAAEVGVSHQSVSMWESDPSVPSLPMFLRLAEVFGWPVPH